MLAINKHRLKLRPLYLADTDDVFESAQDPEVVKNTSWDAHQSRAETQRFIHHFLNRRETE